MTLSPKVSKDVGIEVSHVLLGSQIEAMTDEELRAQVEETNLFAKLNPMQNLKLLLQAKVIRLVLWGWLNDAPALRKLMWAFQ